MEEESTLLVRLPAGRRLIPVKSIERLVSDALLAEIEAKHANDEPLLSGEPYNGAAEDSLDLGFTYRGTDPSSIRLAILKCRAAGRIVVLEAEGRGTIHDDDVLRGTLTREDLGRLLADEWRIGLVAPENEAEAAQTGGLPPPIPTVLLAICFAGLKWSTSERWQANLGKKPKWLSACLVHPGGQGLSEAFWDPVRVGAVLVTKWDLKTHQVRARFQTQVHLKPWLAAWDDYELEHLSGS